MIRIHTPVAPVQLLFGNAQDQSTKKQNLAMTKTVMKEDLSAKIENEIAEAILAGQVYGVWIKPDHQFFAYGFRWNNKLYDFLRLTPVHNIARKF